MRGEQHSDSSLVHIALAEEGIRERNWNNADSSYRMALELDPQNRMAWFGLGKVSVRQKRYGEADSAFRKAIELTMKNEYSYCQLGTSMREEGRLNEALECHKMAVEINPISPQAQGGLGAVLDDLGRFEEAIVHHRKAIELKPISLYHTNLAITLGKMGKKEESIALHRKAVSLDPASGFAHTNLGLALKESGKTAEALVHLRRAVDLEPTLRKGLYNLGICLREQGDFPGAKACFEKSLSIDPDSVEDLMALGISHEKLGNDEDAIKTYERILTINSKNSAPINNLGVIYLNKKYYDKSIKYFKMCISLNPKDSEALSNLGIAYSKNGNIKDAIECFKKSVEINPKAPLGHYHLGIALLENAQDAEAAEPLARAFALDPRYERNAMAQMRFGLALLAKGQLDMAILHLKGAIELEPQLFPAWFGLGICHHNRQEHSLAVEAYRRANSLNDKNPIVHANLGVVLEFLGILEDAEAHYKKALELNPKWVVGPGSLDRIRQLRAAERQLPDFLEGKYQPQTTRERLNLIEVCRHQKRNLLGVRIYEAAMESNPEMVHDRGAFHRYNAACLAVLASHGKGVDSGQIPESEKSRLRSRALTWLKSALVAIQKEMSTTPQEMVRLVQHLNHWQKDSDLSGIREESELAKLPEKEREAFRAFWGEVSQVLKQAETPTTGPAPQNTKKT